MPARRREEFSQKIRREARKRSGGRCERCGKVLWPGDGRVFDHIVACYWGGRGTLENCQLICRECDRAKTARDQRQIARGKRLQIRHQKHLQRMALKDAGVPAAERDRSAGQNRYRHRFGRAPRT